MTKLSILPKYSCEGLKPENALEMEWLTTNGLGGYASSTIYGVNTRKYHGLLVAAFNPPVNRRLILAKLDEEIRIDGEKWALSPTEYREGLHNGAPYLQRFSLTPLPEFCYNIEGIQLTKKIFMPHGKNATIIIYSIINDHEGDVSFKVLPSVNNRHFYHVTDKNNTGKIVQQPSTDGATIKWADKTIHLHSRGFQYAAHQDLWNEKVLLRVDRSRGESCLDDYYQPGSFHVRSVPPRESKCYVFVTAENEGEEPVLFTPENGQLPVENMCNEELERQATLLQLFSRTHNISPEEWLKWLVLAANSFIVHRRSTCTKSVIAGYHWFEDWGRDALISLPGLTLVTGLHQHAREILVTFKEYCEKGVLPNRFPDQTGDKPVYNTVDATLWYFNAVLNYLKYTRDLSFVRRGLWETLCSIIEYHSTGTIHGIKLDVDGLVLHSPQLTWMDATVNDKPVTPRSGKAVEIQALWYNALKTMEMLASFFKEEEKKYAFCRMANKTKESFLEKFWNKKGGFLFDVVGANGARDTSLRPNQIIAAALDNVMLDREKSSLVVEAVKQSLLTPFGLRTLVKGAPHYIGKYVGNWDHRNYAYHNGTVWPWLLGYFVKAFLNVKGYAKSWRSYAFQKFLQPLFNNTLFQAGLGVISEVFDGDVPHYPRGCISQAWSVAEPLRTYVEDILFKRPPYERQVLKRKLDH